MSTSEQSKELSTLTRKLRGEYAGALGEPCDGAALTVDMAEPLLGEFVRSFMIWEATTAKASAALSRIAEAVVDFNELRICLPDEIVRVMGERYPRVEERALRLRSSLAEIYSRQHAVTLEPLLTMGKREAKDYLDSLDGVPRFVSARVSLLCLGGHSAPVDGRIAKRLVESQVVEAGSTPDAAAGALERKVRAGEMLDVYRLLQAWADDAPLNYSDTPLPTSTETPRRREGRTPATVSTQQGESNKRKRARGGREPGKKKSGG